MTEEGGRFRMLTLIDEYTRRCLAIRPGWSRRAKDVIDTVDEMIMEHGRPEHIRSDNGPEFIAYSIQDWLKDRQIKTPYITPGSPWEQGHIESFHDKLRDECTNRELFGSLKEAKSILEDWRKQYNESRPHSSLGYKTPNELAAVCNSRLRSDSVLPTKGVANPRRNTKQEPTQELQF